MSPCRPPSPRDAGAPNEPPPAIASAYKDPPDYPPLRAGRSPSYLPHHSLSGACRTGTCVSNEEVMSNKKYTKSVGRYGPKRAGSFRRGRIFTIKQQSVVSVRHKTASYVRKNRMPRSFGKKTGTARSNRSPTTPDSRTRLSHALRNLFSSIPLFAVCSAPRPAGPAQPSSSRPRASWSTGR
jgi:hypothetical protein